MNKTIHKDISLAANQYPDNIALWSEEGELSYRELDGLSDSLAGWLTQKLSGTGHRVALVLPKSINAIVAILAILKSGNTYVPLGDTWSHGRLSKIFEDGQFALVLVDDGRRDLGLDAGDFLATDSDEWSRALTLYESNEPHELGVKFSSPAIDANSPAYILYTSGSTGTPKGVCVSHRAARHFPDWARREFSLNDKDKVASVSPLTFDLTTFDLFSTLAAGATLYIVPEKMKVFPARLSEFLQQHGISIIYAVPSTLILLMQRGKLENRDLTAMRTVLFAGEEFPVPLFLQFKDLMPKDLEYCNLYGPTETNVCSYYRVPDDFDLPRMPIGCALPETHLFIRENGNDADDSDDECERGELCVAGPTVMTGYHGLDASKADYWVDDPRGIELRAYATGDQVSCASGDVWDYHGRVDNMVKIWGYRVELGEIEACVMEMDFVEQAALVKRSDGEQVGDVLVAFVQLCEVNSETKSADSYQKEAIRHCKANLPPYMIPREIRLLDDFPLNSRGKIDRLVLAKMAKKAAE